ncbi:MAG: nucleotidyltransferase family protein, partial [Rhodothermaceae bacterium]|nr:nucleotidyltransferase family protein [Rhodothermaceae bacterium]
MKGFELMKEREVDWDEVFSIVKNQKILPLVHQTLRDSNLSDVPEEFVNRIRKEFHRNGLLIQMQKNALSHVWKAFSSTSIPVMFFKGPVLGGMAYGSPFWRKPGDIDILIQPSDYTEARQILVGAGYEVNKPPYVERKLRLRGSEMVFSRNGFEVDLHWSL